MCPIWAVDTYSVGSLPSSKSSYKYGPNRDGRLGLLGMQPVHCMIEHQPWTWNLLDVTSSIFLVLADLVFLVYLYQRWVYPVDKKRVNEFGFGGTDEKSEADAKLLEGEAEKGGDKAGEGREEHLQAGITEENISRRIAGMKGDEDSSSVGSGSRIPSKDDKKSS